MLPAPDEHGAEVQAEWGGRGGRDRWVDVTSNPLLFLQTMLFHGKNTYS